LLFRIEDLPDTLLLFVISKPVTSCGRFDFLEYNTRLLPSQKKQNNRCLNHMLEVWRQTLESKEFGLSRTKTKYLKFKFNDVKHMVDVEVRIETSHPKERKSYLSSHMSIIQENREIDDDVTHRIGAGG